MRYPIFIGAIFMFLSFISCKKEFRQYTPLQASQRNLDVNGNRPNIILIIGDDVGREIPTYNGGQSYSTPNLDFMVANGMQFPYFFSHPDGPPSRLALQTGKYNYRNWSKFGYLAPTSQTFANMLKTVGYSTCFVGKWQFDGGDASILSHGYDKYLVFLPFSPQKNNGHDQYYRRYKDPYLYENANYLSDSEVNNQYSEDMFFQYASDFIDSNVNNPFMLVYANTLVQKPWVPTPDDPAYATWDPSTDDVSRANESYFPGMVAYMDKIIGKLINKVDSAGLAQNTLILFTSDNATNKQIRSKYKGRFVKGAKDSTVFDGINVPFLAYWPGTVIPGVDTSLVDMTDFFPTFADISGASDAPYQPLDGTTFYDNLIGAIDSATQRTTVYCYWPILFRGQRYTISYVFNYQYKQYDSLNGGKFFDIVNDPYEHYKITASQMTPDEKKAKQSFKVILRQPYQ
jgi:arylsulfatase A